MKRDINQKIYIGTSLLRKKKHFFTVQKFIGVVNGVHVPKGRRKKKKGSASAQINARNESSHSRHPYFIVDTFQTDPVSLKWQMACPFGTRNLLVGIDINKPLMSA